MISAASASSSTGVTTVVGAVLLDRPRLLQVDGIYCEASLSGNLVFMKNHDVPGVIGHVGTVLGRNHLNIANFSLGRRETAQAGDTDAALGRKVCAVGGLCTGDKR